MHRFSEFSSLTHIDSVPCTSSESISQEGICTSHEDPFSAQSQHPTGPFPAQARDWRALQKSSNDPTLFAKFADRRRSTTLQRHYLRLPCSQSSQSSFLVSARSSSCSMHLDLQ